MKHNQKFLSIEEFRRAARSGAKPEGVVQRLMSGAATEVVGANRTFRFRFSDGSIDRVKDRINPKGWSLDNYMRSPVALWSHLSDQPPIGKSKNVGMVGDALMGDIEFASAEIYAFAETIFLLVKNGFISACSVGFLPLTWEFAKEKGREGGINFLTQELTEISLCAVGCLPSALIQARSMGINSDHIRIIQRELGEREARVIRARKISAAATRLLVLGN